MQAFQTLAQHPISHQCPAGNNIGQGGEESVAENHREQLRLQYGSTQTQQQGGLKHPEPPGAPGTTSPTA